MSIINSNPQSVNTPFHDLVLSSFPGSCVVIPPEAVLTAEKPLPGGDSAAAISNSPVFPFGVPVLLNNSLSSHSKGSQLLNGVVTVEDILRDYYKMVERVDGKRSCLLETDKGEVLTLPVRSRWNSQYDYGWHVGRQLSEEVKGLEKCTHLILTFDPKKVESYAPGWWVYGDEELLWASCGLLVGGFLERLRLWKKKNAKVNENEKWNFLCYVLEPHESGFPHIHMLFYGGWIAPLKVLQELWPFSEPNGVRLGGGQYKNVKGKDGKTKRIYSRNGYCNGQAVSRYLTTYISKDLAAMRSQDVKFVKNKESAFLREVKKVTVLNRCAAFLWFFRRRLYNVRHHYTVNGNLVWGIPRGEYKIIKPKSGWKRYETPKKSEEAREVEIEKDEFVDWSPSEMFLRWKALSDRVPS